MRRASVAAAAGFSLVLGAGGGARAETADPLGDTMGPREIALGEGLRASATGQSATVLNPAGLPLNRELVFEGEYGYRGSDQASLIGVSACDSTAALPGCFFYDYAASNPDSDGVSANRTTHIGGISMAKVFTPRVFLGATVKYFHHDTDVAGETNSDGFNFDLGATVRLTDFINLGVSGQNLWGAQSDEFPRAVGGGVLARPVPILSLGFDMRWKLDGNPKGARYGGGAELFIRSPSGQTGFPLRVGALRDNDLGSTYVSGGLGLATLKYGFDVGARKSVKGMDETVIVASMRLFGPRQPAPGVE